MLMTFDVEQGGDNAFDPPARLSIEQIRLSVDCPFTPDASRKMWRTVPKRLDRFYRAG